MFTRSKCLLLAACFFESHLCRFGLEVEEAVHEEQSVDPHLFWGFIYITTLFGTATKQDRDKLQKVRKKKKL